MKTDIRILSYLARLFKEFSQLCERAQVLRVHFYRCDISRGLTFTKFDKANFDCSQRRDSFQQGIWSVTKSSARRHCLVSGQSVAADKEFSKGRISLGPGILRPLT